MAGLAGTLLGALILQRLAAARAVVVALALQTMALVIFLAAVLASSWLPHADPHWLVALALLKAATAATGFVALYAFMGAGPASTGRRRLHPVPVRGRHDRHDRRRRRRPAGAALGLWRLLRRQAAFGAAGLLALPTLMRRLARPFPGEQHLNAPWSSPAPVLPGWPAPGG